MLVIKYDKEKRKIKDLISQKSLLNNLFSENKISNTIKLDENDFELAISNSLSDNEYAMIIEILNNTNLYQSIKGDYKLAA